MTVKFRIGRRRIIAYATLHGWTAGSRYVVQRTRGSSVFNVFPFGVVVLR